MNKPHYIDTIEELYQWAKENGYEKYQLFTTDEGMTCNVIVEEMIINKKDKEITIQGLTNSQPYDIIKKKEKENKK